MRKLIIAVAVASSFLLSGCAAVIQGGAALAAGNAKDHPANQSFVVGMGKNDAFNTSLRALTANGRKVTSSDREAGIVQGTFDDYAVTIKIAGKSGGAVVDLTVAYNQSFIYGASQVEKVSTVLKGEIEGAASKRAESVTHESVTVAQNDTVAAPVKVAKNKHGSKKVTAQ